MTNSTRSFLPCLPSLLTLMAQGHTGYYYFHSFPHVCLSVCLSVCPSARTSVSFFLSAFVSSVWPCAFSRTAEISFRMLSRAPPEASLFPPLLHVRETGLLVFCARHVTESPRGRLCCWDVIPPAPRSVGFFPLDELCERIESGTLTL